MACRPLSNDRECGNEHSPGPTGPLERQTELLYVLLFSFEFFLSDRQWKCFVYSAGAPLPFVLAQCVCVCVHGEGRWPGA